MKKAILLFAITLSISIGLTNAQTPTFTSDGSFVTMTYKANDAATDILLIGYDVRYQAGDYLHQTWTTYLYSLSMCGLTKTGVVRFPIGSIMQSYSCQGYFFEQGQTYNVRLSYRFANGTMPNYDAQFTVGTPPPTPPVSITSKPFTGKPQKGGK